MKPIPLDHQKVLLTGTGRSGTSFAMQILTALGLPTGFDRPEDGFFTDRMCGQEVVIPEDAERGEMWRFPHVVKDPRLAWTLRGLLERGALEPLHVYVLVRDVRDAARSRVDREMAWAVPGQEEALRVAGDRNRLEAQVGQLHQGLGILLETLALHEVPFTLVQFPRLVDDGGYFARAFRGLLGDFPVEAVVAAHRRIADPSHVHYRGSGESE